MHKCLFLIWFVFGLVFLAGAQKPDTAAAKKTQGVSQKADTGALAPKTHKPKVTKENAYQPDTLHDPHKAVMRSAIIPGWGQVYNHHWWKVPFVYGGLILLGDVVVYNQHYYKLFLNEALLREKGIVGTPQNNPTLTQVSDQDVINATDSYHRDRDLGILGFLGFWGVQMVDAYVSAKFQHSFSMDNNLSIKIKPALLNQPSYAFNNPAAYIPGITVTFALK
jgi:hypothetical protein